MKVKVSELTGPALDWTVAGAEGNYSIFYDCGYGEIWAPSTDWAQGGPIIEREKIELRYHDVIVAGIWYRDGIGSDECSHKAIGPTPLIAAMRCYVVSKLGEEVEIPEGFK